MVTLHLLGHVHVSREQEVVRVSSKAAALLSYLTLEGQPHHREHLAGLLWNTPDALRNLRVELARLKAQGLAPFPARQPMLGLGGGAGWATDLSGWLHDPEPRHERDLTAWLSRLRGPALSGLEDLGSTAFRGWVDQQRQVIHDQIEERLGTVSARFARQGQPQAAALVRARADLLGLHLDPCLVPPSTRSPQDLAFEWPEQRVALRQRLTQAETSPQLLLLQGHRGTRRELLEDAVRGTPWQVVQLQASSQRQLVQAALTQQLTRLLPPDLRAQAQALPKTADADAQLIGLTGLLGQAEVPLLLAIHDASHVPTWFMQVLRFALDLPWPLLVVVTTTSAQHFGGLQVALGQVAGRRLHTLTLPPLSVHSVMRSLGEQEAPGQHETRRARAARLVQRSEGQPLHVRALAGAGPDAARDDLRLPDEVRAMLLADLALPAGIQEALARLAQIHDRFDLALAWALLGDAAGDVLRAGSRAGLLVPAELQEVLTLPDLRHRSSDAEAYLGFASELTRSALAGTLPAAERHEVRSALAALLLPTQPALSRIYAERAHLPDLAEAARAALPGLPTAEFRAAPATLVDEPPAREQPRHETRTPNGYRVALECGWLEVLRRGRLGPPPLLSLRWPGVPAGRWTLTARLDVVSGTLEPGFFPFPFALGLRTGQGPRVVYGAEPLPDHEADGVDHTFGGVLPMGRWFRLSGQNAGGRPELSVRAVDVALTVGDLEWGGQSLLEEAVRAGSR